MRFDILTKDESCGEALEEFSKMFVEEWNKSIKNLPEFLSLPNAEPLILEAKDGWALVIPIKMPRLLRPFFRKKKKLIENLEGFLRKKGIEFEKIKYSD